MPLPCHRPARASRRRLLAAIGLALVVGAGSLLGGPSAAAAAPFASERGPCPGPVEAPTFTGQLSLLGGPLPDSVVGGVNLSYAYWQQNSTYYLANETTVVSCVLESGVATTQANGVFGFSIFPPGETCSGAGGGSCTNYSAPHGPVSVAPVAPNPAGYGLADVPNGSRFSLAWVAGLSSVSLTPSTVPEVVSTSAPTTLDAEPWSANGSVSPLTPVFGWNVSGLGWSFAAPPGTSDSATVVAAPDAGWGNLTVEASATVGANTFRTPGFTVPLEPVRTAVTSGSVNLTAVDVGSPVGLTVAATGAVGYPYTATISPGLGQASFSVPCGTSPGPSSTVAVRCSATVIYSSLGTAEPVAEVSNGFSSAGWTAPNVTVHPPSALALTPSSPVGYAGVPTPITLTVAAGTGVLPYSRACLAATGFGVACASPSGSSWTFRPTFATPANYSGSAWVVDAVGVNRSIPFTVHVLPALAVGPVTLGAPNVSAGVAVTVLSDLIGGALPASVWWNASTSASPLAAYPVDADGPLSFEFVPRAPGSLELSLTVRDALGTTVEANRTVAVVVGPASSVRLAVPAPSGPLTVGTPVPLAWLALGAIGEPVPAFQTAAVLSVAGPSGAPARAWANSSESGPLSAAPENSFVVPSAAWHEGELNLTVTPVSAGALTVTLGGPGIPGPYPTVSLVAAADGSRLRLFDPTVELAGERTNRTYWHVSDRFGNPVPGAYLTVQYLASGGVVDELVAVRSAPDGETGAWVNYTLPAGGGTVRVLDAAGDVLLPPVVWSPPGSAAPLGLSDVAVAGAALTGSALALTTGLLRRRRYALPLLDDEAAARELAEGRAAVVELIRAAGTICWEEFTDSWEPPPVPPELGEWLSSLLADGTVIGEGAPDGRVGYRLAPSPPTHPQVTVDANAVERAVARREAAVRGEEPADP